MPRKPILTRSLILKHRPCAEQMDMLRSLLKGQPIVFSNELRERIVLALEGQRLSWTWTAHNLISPRFYGTLLAVDRTYDDRVMQQNAYAGRWFLTNAGTPGFAERVGIFASDQRQRIECIERLRRRDLWTRIFAALRRKYGNAS